MPVLGLRGRQGDRQANAQDWQSQFARLRCFRRRYLLTSDCGQISWRTAAVVLVGQAPLSRHDSGTAPRVPYRGASHSRCSSGPPTAFPSPWGICQSVPHRGQPSQPTLRFSFSWSGFAGCHIATVYGEHAPLDHMVCVQACWKRKRAVRLVKNSTHPSQHWAWPSQRQEVLATSTAEV